MEYFRLGSLKTKHTRAICISIHHVTEHDFALENAKNTPSNSIVIYINHYEKRLN